MRSWIRKKVSIDLGNMEKYDDLFQEYWSHWDGIKLEQLEREREGGVGGCEDRSQF